MVTGLLAGAAGAALAGGVALAGLAWVGVDRSPGAPRRSSRPARLVRFTGVQYRRGAAAVAAAVLVWLVTGWVVAGVGAGLSVAVLPVMLSTHRAERVIERLDALAVWTRRLADLLASGAGGLDYALVASARTAPPVLQAEITALAIRAQVRGGSRRCGPSPRSWPIRRRTAWWRA